MELAFIPLGNDKTVQRLCDSSRISDEQILPLPMLAEPIDGIDPSLRGLSLDVSVVRDLPLDFHDHIEARVSGHDEVRNMGSQ